MATEREGRKREREGEGGKGEDNTAISDIKVRSTILEGTLKILPPTKLQREKKLSSKSMVFCLIGNLQWALSISRAAVKWLLVMHTGQAIARC